MCIPSLTLRPGVLLLGTTLLCATCLVGGAAKPAAAESADPAAALEGTPVPGSEKQSPYTAAKETGAAMTGNGTGGLWALLAPIALAAGSYGVLRSREKDGTA